jgi:protein TonB
MAAWQVGICAAALAVAAAQPVLAAAQRGSGNADYPPKALREGREGTTYFRVTVGSNGRAKNCTITRSSGSADLDSETCKMIATRGRWQPAKNETGEPVEDVFSGKLEWKLPH